jgi:hypothetical protein
MNITETKNGGFRLSARHGTAMTELVLVSFFLYVPIVMMIIIWGDMTLDKERAHVAAAYMTFSTTAVDDEFLRQEFFPLATGARTGTMSEQAVAVDADDTTEGPLYELPTGGGDYGLGEPPEFDLQYKLYSLAAGEVFITYDLQATPDGRVDFMANVQIEQDDVARYLVQNQIVNTGQLASGSFQMPMEQALNLLTSADSKNYTHYVETLTNIFNGRWNAEGIYVGGEMGNVTPTYESETGLRTVFRSPFLWDLNKKMSLEPGFTSKSSDMGLQREQGDIAFTMHVGATDLTPKNDDSFKAGYSYLRNPNVVVSASRIRQDMYELSDTMFEYNGARIHEMESPLSTERGADDLRFLTPGDPR